MGVDVQSLSDAVLLENTASRLLRVRDDLLTLGRNEFAAGVDLLLAAVVNDAAEIRERADAANAAAAARAS